MKPITTEEQTARALRSLQQAASACGPTKQNPLGDPQAIATFNAIERKRETTTPYGQHKARMEAFNQDESTDKLTDDEFNALLNATHAKSYKTLP